MQVKIGWLLSVFSFSLYAANSSAITISKMFEYFLDRSRLVEDQKTKALFTIYKDACQFVITKNYTNVPDEICYKLEAARIAFTLGDDIFAKHILPIICDEIRIMRLKDYKRKSAESGLNAFFKNNFCNPHILINASYLRNGSCPSVVYGDHTALYVVNENSQSSNYCLSLVYNDKSTELLIAPSYGLVFAFGFYCGKIDFSMRKAFLYKKLRNGQDEEIYDLSKAIPWTQFNDSVVCEGFNDSGLPVLCFTVSQPSLTYKLFYYKFARVFSVEKKA